LNIQASIDNEENRKVDLNNGIQKLLNLLAYTTGTTAFAGNNFDFELNNADPSIAMDSSLKTISILNLPRIKLIRRQEISPLQNCKTNPASV